MTETTLGFSLPPLLRTLYATLANGDFGPDYGLHGAIGGCEPTIVDMYLWRKEYASLIDLAFYAGARELNPEKYLELPHHLWPEQLLPLSDQGCARETCVDGKTGRLFMVAPFSNETYGISYLAPSIEDWLETWLRATTPLHIPS